MKYILIIILIIFSPQTWADPVQIPYQYNKKTIKLNANHYTNSTSKSIALILHGTRGHQNLELIGLLANSLLDHNIDSLTVNLSYGIDNRDNDFLPCDIENEHLKSKSIKELELWFDLLQSKGYKNIYLIGHSRGGLNMIQFFEELGVLEKNQIESIFLIAPVSDNYLDIKKHYKRKNNIDMDILLDNSDEWLTVDFLNCTNSKVLKKSFLDYFDISDEQSGMKGSLLGNLLKTDARVFVITGSQDVIVPKTHERVQALGKENVELIIADDADHFFRDFYFDDLMDVITQRIN